MKNIFVSGGAGFIGSHLVDRLVEMGQVTVFDNLLSGKKAFIQHHFDKPGFCFIEGDLRDAQRVTDAMVGHDMVFHFAANPDAMLGAQNTRLDLELETIATYNILEAMRIQKVKEIVFASSGSVYGETPIIPLGETYGPLLPISMYGAAKLACEGLISAYCHCFNMKGWMYRFANIVGGRSTHGVIYDFIKKLRQNSHELLILGDGSQEKPYLHVEECVSGILFGYQHARDQVNLFCLGSETSINVNQIAKIVTEELGLEKIKFTYSGGDRGWTGDVPQVRFDVSKIAKLGWKARHTSSDAVRLATRQIVAEYGLKKG